jgi:curved DNA-binding protein
MREGRDFVDYYHLMQVSPHCDTKILDSAYRYLAKRYHPDHAQTVDVGKFSELTEAYSILRDPDKRAEYDRSYFAKEDEQIEQPILDRQLETDEKTAVRDSEIQQRMLLQLYKKRREHAQDPGVIGWTLQEMLGCSEENFEFHVWYLKSKGFIEKTEQGTLAITIQGVDHVISTSRSSLAQKLLMDQSDSPTHEAY